MKKSHSCIFLEHIAMQSLSDWGESQFQIRNCTDCFSRRKLGCRHLVREWYIRHSILAIPVGVVWWHKDFQCYRCAHYDDSHWHFAELSSLMSACIYKQHSNRTLYAYFHRTCNLDSWLLWLNRMDSWSLFTLSSNTQDLLCVSLCRENLYLETADASYKWPSKLVFQFWNG